MLSHLLEILDSNHHNLFIVNRDRVYKDNVGRTFSFIYLGEKRVGRKIYSETMILLHVYMEHKNSHRTINTECSKVIKSAISIH